MLTNTYDTTRVTVQLAQQTSGAGLGSPSSWQSETVDGWSTVHGHYVLKSHRTVLTKDLNTVRETSEYKLENAHQAQQLWGDRRQVHNLIGRKTL